jgi:hypothetical protein
VGEPGVPPRYAPWGWGGGGGARGAPPALRDACFLHAGPEVGQQVAERLELTATVREQPGERREFSRMLVAALARELGRVLGQSTLDAIALRVKRKCAGVAVGKGVLEVRPVRVVAPLQAVEEHVDALGDCGQFVSHSDVSRPPDYFGPASGCL